MKMRTFIGLCAALAFAAGSTTVHALKIVDAANTNPATDGRASNTYAKETLLSTETTDATDDSDTTTYYNIDEEGHLPLGAGRHYGQCGGYLHRQLHAGRHGVPDRRGERRLDLNGADLHGGCGWCGWRQGGGVPVGR